MTRGVVRVLGWLVIAHGLSHAVLPLRGSLGPTMLLDDWIPVGLYTVGMIGFVAAGMGLLGLRPLDVAISPLLVLASGLSLVAIIRFGDPTLRFGALCNVALLIIGAWRGYGGWPAHPAHGRAVHSLGTIAGFTCLAYLAVATTTFPWHRTWGSTREELLMALPGDRVPRNPGVETQRAVTIDASPEAVRQWVQQLGHEPFVVLSAPAGKTRLIMRSIVSSERTPIWTSALRLVAVELAHFIIERRLMLTIKSLAEEQYVPPTSVRR